MYVAMFCSFGMQAMRKLWRTWSANGPGPTPVECNATAAEADVAASERNLGTRLDTRCSVSPRGHFDDEFQAIGVAGVIAANPRHELRLHRDLLSG